MEIAAIISMYRHSETSARPPIERSRRGLRERLQIVSFLISSSFSFFRSLKEERKRKTPKEEFFLSSSSSSSLFPLPGFRSSQNVCTISVNFSRRQKFAKNRKAKKRLQRFVRISTNLLRMILKSFRHIFAIVAVV